MAEFLKKDLTKLIVRTFVNGFAPFASKRLTNVDEETLVDLWYEYMATDHNLSIVTRKLGERHVEKTIASSTTDTLPANVATTLTSQDDTVEPSKPLSPVEHISLDCNDVDDEKELCDDDDDIEMNAADRCQTIVIDGSVTHTECSEKKRKDKKKKKRRSKEDGDREMRNEDGVKTDEKIKKRKRKDHDKDERKRLKLTKESLVVKCNDSLSEDDEGRIDKVSNNDSMKNNTQKDASQTCRQITNADTMNRSDENASKSGNEEDNDVGIAAVIDTEGKVSSEYDAMTTIQLKTLCRDRKLMVKGSKNEIVERLRAFDENRIDTKELSKADDFDYGEYAKFNVIELAKICGEMKLKVKGTKRQLVERLLVANVKPTTIAERVSASTSARNSFSESKSRDGSTAGHDDDGRSESGNSIGVKRKLSNEQRDSMNVTPSTDNGSKKNSSSLTNNNTNTSLPNGVFASTASMQSSNTAQSVDEYGTPYDANTRYILTDKGTVMGYKDSEGYDRPLTAEMKQKLLNEKRSFGDLCN